MSDASEPESGGGRSAGRSKASKTGDHRAAAVAASVLPSCSVVLMSGYL